MSEPTTSATHATASPGAHARRRVLIAGAGVGALEALLGVRALAGDAVELHVLAPGESFVHRPLAVAEAFGTARGHDLDVSVLLKAERVGRTVDTLDSVDTDECVVRTRFGTRLGYDELVLATGARAVPAVAGALAFRGRADVPALQAMLGDLDSGAVSHVVFALGRGNAWPVPLYELAAMTARRIVAQRLSARVSIVTAESAPLERLGPAASDAVAEILDARGIEIHLDADPLEFRAGALRLAGGTELRADRVVALPLLRGPAIDGLPNDADGFIRVDAYGRVEGAANTYAAGDATSYALKQGGLAVAQAGAVARLISARAGTAGTVRPFPPVVRGFLLATTTPLYVRIDAVHGEPLATPAGGEAPDPAPRSRRRFDPTPAANALWWPPSALAGSHLAARYGPRPAGTVAALPQPTRHERTEAAALALMLADHDAWAGDPAMALSALECAEALTGTLPAQYRARRRHWRDAAEAQGASAPCPSAC